MEDKTEKETKKSKEDTKNCWEFWNCPEEMKRECSAYKSNIGRQCWLVCNMSKKSKTMRQDLECTNCEWYKKINNLT